jgi:hypothetical protein
VWAASDPQDAMLGGCDDVVEGVAGQIGHSTP